MTRRAASTVQAVELTGTEAGDVGSETNRQDLPITDNTDLESLQMRAIKALAAAEAGRKAAERADATVEAKAEALTLARSRATEAGAQAVVLRFEAGKLLRDVSDRLKPKRAWTAWLAEIKVKGWGIRTITDAIRLHKAVDGKRQSVERFASLAEAMRWVTRHEGAQTVGADDPSAKTEAHALDDLVEAGLDMSKISPTTAAALGSMARPSRPVPPIRRWQDAWQEASPGQRKKMVAWLRTQGVRIP